MSTPADISVVSEHDSHSDSDWLDIASTDRDSDDTDSIYSSREADHEDVSRSRSRLSSLSYGSSRDGDVDAWEGLIDDSADEGMPNDVPAPNHHVPSLSQHPATVDSNPVQEASPEELRVQEGLDQSMISTLSSSRSSSLHASTVHNSSRDLRLSFPDPITSSCTELLSTSYEEIQRNSETPPPLADLGIPADTYPVDDEQMLFASQTFSPELQQSRVPSSGPELKVLLYGFSPAFKWSLVNKLLEKVVHGAGFTITPDIDDLQGSIRQLTVSGSTERDHAFPRAITVLDRTLETHDISDDPALLDISGVRPLAIAFLPCRPLRLPEHVLLLPVHSDIETSSPWTSPDLVDISHHQILRLSAREDSLVVNMDSIERIDSTRAYRAFTRLWSGDNNMSKGGIASTHALTIIAILSLVLGVVVRAAIPLSQYQFSSPTLVPSPNYTGGAFWHLLRPAPYRERLPPSTIPDSSAVPIPPAFKEFSLAVFNTESTSITSSRANPTTLRRVVSSTLSEHPTFSKDLMLQPPRSLLPPDERSKALSVILETTPTSSCHPGPASTGHAVSVLVHTSVPNVVKEYASVVFALVNQDMQDIFDALDALVQAISRQTQMFLTRATAFIEQSAMQLKSVESFDAIKETLYVHNEQARKRAKEIREMGTKWLYDASEAITIGAQFSKGVAWEMAESLAHRAQRARGKAKEMATEVRDFVHDYEKLEVPGISVWDAHTRHWVEWVESVSRQGEMGKPCKKSRRKLNSAIIC